MSMASLSVSRMSRITSPTTLTPLTNRKNTVPTSQHTVPRTLATPKPSSLLCFQRVVRGGGGRRSTTHCGRGDRGTRRRGRSVPEAGVGSGCTSSFRPPTEDIHTEFNKLLPSCRRRSSSSLATSTHDAIRTFACRLHCGLVLGQYHCRTPSCTFPFNTHLLTYG
jgi:hypothetical protein